MDFVLHGSRFNELDLYIAVIRVRLQLVDGGCPL